MKIMTMIWSICTAMTTAIVTEKNTTTAIVMKKNTTTAIVMKKDMTTATAMKKDMTIVTVMKKNTNTDMTTDTATEGLRKSGKLLLPVT